MLLNFIKKIRSAVKNNSLFSILGTIVCSLLLHPPNDPDLWWHLKVGKQLGQGIFPFEDTFSFTMPGYRWVDHEWLTDGIIYSIYRCGGLLLLGFVFVIIFLSAYLIALRAGMLLAKRRSISLHSPPHYLLLVLLLLAALLANYSVLGTRPQMITLLGFAIVNYILWSLASDGPDRTILLPFVFLLWVNLHGGYLIGFALIAVFVLTVAIEQIVTKKKECFVSLFRLSAGQLKKIFFYSSLSVVACLINPYGIRIFTESFSTTLDAYAHIRIAEWLPVNIFSLSGFVYLLYAAFSVALLLKIKRRVPLSAYLQLLLFMLLSISSWRHSPFFVLISLPFLYYALEDWQPLSLALQRIKVLFSWKSDYKSRRFFNYALILGCCSLFLSKALTVSLSSLSPSFYATENNYPYEAIQFLQSTPKAGHIFNMYVWGGYLIWHMPEEKVFIDGRMASWKDERYHILKTYYDITENKDISAREKKLGDFGITQILLPPDQSLAKELDKSHLWHMAYQDDIAIIFERL